MNVNVKPMHSINWFCFLMLFAFQSFAQNSGTDVPVQYYDWEAMPGQDYGDLKWYEVLELDASTYEEVRKAFYKEWDGKAYEPGRMYKQFKRYEAMTLGVCHGKKKSLDVNVEMQHILNATQGKRSTNGSQWISKGPNAPPQPATWNNQGIGRIDEIAFHPFNENIVYAGAPSGGLWKSEDGGQNWKPLGDVFMNLGISGIEISRQDPDRIYVSTGTRDGGSFSPSFFGVLGSDDGGQNWNVLPFPAGVSRVYKLLLSQENDLHLCLATNNGIYCTRDGGQSWTKSNGIAGSVRDIEWQPGNEKRIYASKYGEWYESNDGGISFVNNNALFTPQNTDNINIGVTGANPDVVYFFAWDKPSNSFKLYKYTYTTKQMILVADKTSPGQHPNGNAIKLTDYYWGQAFYDWSFAIHPENEQEMFIGDISLFRTSDGGKTWTVMSGSSNDGGSVHVDMHTVEYSTETKTPWVGCDGGIYRFAGPGKIWTRLNNLGITQVYRFGISKLNDDLILCGNQDNGVFQRNDNGWNYRIIGDGSECIIDPIDPSKMYGTIGNSGRIYKSTNGIKFDVQFLVPQEEQALWLFPLKMHPQLRHVLYTGFNNVWRTIDGGVSWEKISDFQKSESITDVEIAPSNPSFIYTAFSSAAGLYRSEDGGKNWQMCTYPQTNLPVQDLLIHPGNEKILYAAIGQTIMKSTDAGESWLKYNDGIENTVVLTLAYVNDADEELYAGTSLAVYHKSTGQPWELFNEDLPHVLITELEVNEKHGTISAATFGRGIWQSPLAKTSGSCYLDQVAEITQDGRELTCTIAPEGYGYQWYRGDSLLTGENTSKLIVDKTGIYAVVYTGSCHAFSSDFIEIKELSGPLTFYQYVDATSCFNEINFGPTKSGEYPFDTTYDAAGNLTIHILRLVVNPVSEVNIDVMIENGESYEGYQFPGTYRDTFSRVGTGCDSIRVINLSVNNYDLCLLNPNSVGVKMTDVLIKDFERDAVSIDVLVHKFNSITAAEFSILWDSQALELIDIQNIHSVFDQPFVFNKEPDYLKVLWISNDLLNGNSLEDSTILFTMIFRVNVPGKYSIQFGGTQLLVSSDRNEFGPLAFCDGSILSEISTRILDEAFPDLIIFPNPGTGQFTVQSNIPIDRIEVFDVLGRFIFHDNKSAFYLRQSGLYFVKIYSGKNIGYRSIIVE